MKIGITADSSSGLEYAPFKHHVKITKTVINFGDVVYTDGVDIKADAFYEKLRNTDIVPTTSAPSTGEIINRINEYKKEGYTDVIHIPISFGLSAYGINLTNTLEEMVTDINVHVVNSNSACLMEGYVAKYAEVLADLNYPLEEIFNELEKIKLNTNAYFIVDDLKYLVKNGRLNVFSGFIGNMAKIKPILNLGKNGTIDQFDKVRTYSKALKRMIDLISEEYKNYQEVIYIILHTGEMEKAEEAKTLLSSNVNNAKRIEITTITPTVGAHIGAGLVGIAAIAMDGLKEKDNL